MLERVPTPPGCLQGFRLAQPTKFWKSPSRLLEVYFWRTTHQNTGNMSEAAPAQYKQKSRKGKKAWRKNVDVTEVSAGLNEVRDQIIAG